MISHGTTQSNYILVCLTDLETVLKLPKMQERYEEESHRGGL